MIARPSSQNQDTSESPTPQCSPLKYQRLLRGWSQQDVADELYKLCEASGRSGIGITVEMVSRWERRRYYPSPIYRRHLCALYGLTADQVRAAVILHELLHSTRARGPDEGDQAAIDQTNNDVVKNCIN